MDKKITINAAKNIATLLKAKENEKILLISDESTKGIIEPVKDYFENNNFDITYLNENLIFDVEGDTRPYSKLPSIINAKIDEEKFDKVLVSMKKMYYDTEKLDFRYPLKKLVEKNGGLYASLLSVNPDLIEKFYSFDLDKIREFTLRLQDYMNNTKMIDVHNFGKKASFRFDTKTFPWMASDGTLNERISTIVPGEIYVRPTDANGSMVIDGTYEFLNIHPDYKDNNSALLAIQRNAITFDIINGKIVRPHSDDRKLDKILKETIHAYGDNTASVGRIGFGTNLYSNFLTGSNTLDKRRGFSLTHGETFDLFPKMWRDDIEKYDFNLYKPFVVNAINNETIMHDGIYNTELILKKKIISISKVD